MRKTTMNGSDSWLLQAVLQLLMELCGEVARYAMSTATKEGEQLAVACTRGSVRAARLLGLYEDVRAVRRGTDASLG